MQYPDKNIIRFCFSPGPAAAVLLLLWGVLLASCASSSPKQHGDAGAGDRDSKISHRDLLQPDLLPPRDANAGAEALHFWDASSGQDQSMAQDTVTATDYISPVDQSPADTLVSKDSQPTADLSQGPNPGPVQCRKDSDCGGTMTCNMSAPGGICLGCGICPGWLDCYTGACVRDCYTDLECNKGFRCNSSDLCVLRACDSSTPCPAPYTCGSNNFCARPVCPSGSCPPPLVCINALCLEP